MTDLMDGTLSAMPEMHTLIARFDQRTHGQKVRSYRVVGEPEKVNDGLRFLKADGGYVVVPEGGVVALTPVTIVEGRSESRR